MASDYKELLKLTINQGQNIAGIKQQLTDMVGWIKEIKVQTTQTNGQVGENKIDIGILQNNEELRKENVKETKQDERAHKDWSIRKAAVVVAAVIGIVTLLGQYLF